MRDGALVGGVEHGDEGGGRAGSLGAFVGGGVEAAPLLLERREGSGGFGGEESQPGESRQAAADDGFEKIFAKRYDAPQLLLQIGRKLSVENFGHHPEWQHLEIFGRVEKARTEVFLLLEVRKVGFDMVLDLRNVILRVPMEKRDLGHSTQGLPVATAQESNALTKQLTHQVTRIVVRCFHMFIRVAEDCLQVFRPR